jgi:hypothetical protein
MSKSEQVEDPTMSANQQGWRMMFAEGRALAGDVHAVFHA